MAIAANQAAPRATLRSSYDYIVIGYSMAGRDDRVPNALGGLIGGAIVDNSFGASAIPFAAAVVPALLFILSQERGSSVAPALSQPSLKEGTL
jgi:predicted MFS family arabinose efflux permease